MVIEVKPISLIQQFAAVMQKTIRMKLQEVMKILFYLVLLPGVVWGTALAPLPPIWNSSNSFLKRLTSNEHWSRVASTHFGGTTM